MYRNDARSIFHYLNNGRPVRLHWGGWESDSYRLERQGWKFFSSEEKCEQTDSWRIHLAATSPDTQVTISGVRYIGRGDFMNKFERYEIEHMVYEGWDMQQYSCKDVYRSTNYPEINSWLGMKPVNMKAETVASREQLWYMKDFRVFALAENTLEKEIYIPEHSVDDLFNKILQIQFPEQQEIKKGLIMPAAKPIVQAKIFSLVV